MGRRYIDKNAVLAEIDKRINVLQNHPKENHKTICHLDAVKQFLNTLEVKEVDLERELNNWRHNHFRGRVDINGLSGEYLERTSQLDIARHFFELGLNTQHSSINIPNIDDILEESGIDPSSKEAEIFKESYYMALEKFKSQKGEKL